jgi:hypothetical protein
MPACEIRISNENKFSCSGGKISCITVFILIVPKPKYKTDHPYAIEIYVLVMKCVV